MKSQPGLRERILQHALDCSGPPKTTKQQEARIETTFLLDQLQADREQRDKRRSADLPAPVSMP